MEILICVCSSIPIVAIYIVSQFCVIIGFRNPEDNRNIGKKRLQRLLLAVPPEVKARVDEAKSSDGREESAIKRGKPVARLSLNTIYCNYRPRLIVTQVSYIVTAIFSAISVSHRKNVVAQFRSYYVWHNSIVGKK